MHESMTDVSYDIPRSMLWSVIVAGDKYSFKFDLLTGWFEEWYNRNERDEDLARDEGKSAQELLFPFWAFEHIKGFLRVTRWLVYNRTSHIVESNPTKLKHIHLPSRVIRRCSPKYRRRECVADCLEQLNSARGRLKAVLHDQLWQPIERPLTSGPCNCKEKTLFEYQKAMLKAKVWPLERTFAHTSVSEILFRLTQITYEGEPDSCDDSRIDCRQVVQKTVRETGKYFDSLCLRCMYKTTATGPRRSDDDYWTHHQHRDWDETCRGYGIRHGQATWYYSYMGSTPHKDAREAWYEKRRFESSFFYPY